MVSNVLDVIKVDGRIPTHIAVIMDGNGRWARRRGLPRHRGHLEGMKSVRDVIEGAIEAGVPILTLFAFSQENWNRPKVEVAALMALLQQYVKKERDELIEQGVEVRVHGERERLVRGALAAVEEIEEATRGGEALRLNLMISYGARAELARAARRIAERVRAGELRVDEIDEATLAGELYTAGVADPDLLIRTSGEQRISNFMLWQLAYTELYVTPLLWPDFRREHLFEAIRDFQRRERRFGRVTAV